MRPTTTITVEMDQKNKEQAEAILGNIGLPLSEAIYLFLLEVILNDGLPFNLSIWQKTTNKQENHEESRKRASERIAQITKHSAAIWELSRKLLEGKVCIKNGEVAPGEVVFARLRKELEEWKNSPEG